MKKKLLRCWFLAVISIVSNSFLFGNDSAANTQSLAIRLYENLKCVLNTTIEIISPSDVSLFFLPMPPGFISVRVNVSSGDAEGLTDSSDPDRNIVTKYLYPSGPGQGLDRIDPVATADNATVTSVALVGASGGGTPHTLAATEDNKSGRAVNSSCALTFTEADLLKFV